MNSGKFLNELEQQHTIKATNSKLKIYWRVNGCVDKIDYIVYKGKRIDPVRGEKWKCYFEGDTEYDYKTFESIVDLNDG